jgi:secondary thiamine-phosphate synthase enzyme
MNSKAKVDMEWHKAQLSIPTNHKGMYDFTDLVMRQIREWGVSEGMCFLYVQHTSASLVISESYDPTARQDMETYLEKMVPEGEGWQRHTMEGSDDSASHIRSMLTSVSLAIPVDEGRLSLGTWQGIYLFEHRRRNNARHVLMRFIGF